MKAWFRRLVDILSSLERPQEKGDESESCNYVTCQSTLIRQAVHFLGVSAKHFQQCVQFFRLAVCFAANSLKNSSKNLIHKTIYLLCGAGQSKGHTSRCSCPPENAKKQLLSNAEKVDDSNNLIILVPWIHSASFSNLLGIIFCLLLVFGSRHVRFRQHWGCGSEERRGP